MTIIKRFLTLFLIATASVAAWGAEASVTFSSLYSSNTVVDGTAITITSGMTATFGKRSGGTDTQYYTNGSAVRWYGGGTLAISSTIGNITAITITYTRNDNAISADIGTWSSPNWTGNTANIVFSQAGTSGHLRISSIAVTYTPSGGSCTDPTTPLSISSAATATVGNSLSLTTAGGNGSAVTWSIVSGGSYATLSGSTLTPTAVGTVRVQASQNVSGGKCGATITQDITISLAPIDVTLNRNGNTEVINNVIVGTALDDIDGTGAQGGCEAWTFEGWSKSQRAAQDNSAPMDLVTTVDDAGPYYAVYKNGDGASVVFDPATDQSLSLSLEKGGITISTSNGSFSEGTDYRIYKGATFTVNAGSNIISSISLSYQGSSYDGGGWPTEVSPNATSWSRTTTSGSSGEQARITSLSVTAGTVYYSTTASCGPKVQATASPWVTSTNGQFVKVEVPVTATNFDKSSTLSASVSGEGFSIVGWGANGNSVTKDVDLTTTLILAYNPSAYNTTADATITFGSNYSGSQTPIYTPGTVHGRSLPEKFVIAIKNGDQWLALPANMSGSGTYAGIAVDVDNTTNPTKVTAGPATALYSLLNVYKTSGAGDRYADYGTRVRFLGNEKCLWSNQANGGTGINNGAVPASATSDNYEWTLATTDGITYAINTNVQQKITEGRELRYRAGESRFGMYTDGNSSFRFLPVDCDSRASVSAVATTYNSVTLTWTGKSGTDYNVYIDESGVTKKTETSVTSPVTISGLSSATNYTWIISPGAKNDDCALSGDFTTGTAPINVTLSCDGITYPLGAQDKPYTLPTTGTYVADACAEWQFVGWTNGTYNKNTSAPTLITEMNADGTAYAVYRHTEGGGGSEKYVRVTATDQITNGQYLIMCNSYGAADDDPDDDYDYYTAFKGSLSALDANNNSISNIKRNFEEDTIGVTSTTTANEFTINITETTIKSASGYYIGNTGTGNGMNTSTSTKYTNTMAINGDGEFICEGSGGGVYLQYNHSASRFRYYSSSQTAIQLYKRTTGNTSYYATSSECCNEVAVPTVVVEPVDVSATISWDNQSGATNGYHITCSNGTDQDVAAGVTSLEIIGLTSTTEYEYTVTAKGEHCNRSITGTFTTTSCHEIPRNVSVTPSTSSAIVRWEHASSTATVTVYSDNTCSDVVVSEDGLTSGSSISGLDEGKTYYLRVFAGVGCGSAIIEFTTQSSAVIIAEWFPDSIRINLTADTATATVLIENKQESTSTSSNVAEDIFFSKYFEAAGHTKLVGLYNGTDHDIDISDLEIKGGLNGSWNSAKRANNYIRLSDVSKLKTDYGDGAGRIMLPKNTEIIFYSLNNENRDQVSGEECLDKYYHWDDLENNNVPNWYRMGLPYQTGTTIDEDEHNRLNFSGPQSISLWRDTIIDIIGAGSNGAPFDSATIKITTPHDIGDGRTVTPNDAKGFFCEDGISPPSDEYPSGYNTFLTTNRCLLVRKNTVVSGKNSVAKNKREFITLCEEWMGVPVGNDGTSEQRNCFSGQQFGYVGDYNYNDYYAQFDSLTTVDELGGNQNEDGTFTIPIPDLDELSCTMLRVNVYEGKELKTSAEYKVPIMVEAGTVMTNDEIFKKHEIPTCKECDVVILKGATLEKTNGANDRDEVRNLTIYPGGTLIVPNGVGDYTVQSVQFRVEKENAPVAKLNGNLITKDEQVIVTRRIKNDRYYFFSLPYDCNIADIHWSNGLPATQGVDYQIVEYDGERRANEGSQQGAPGHWKPVEGSQIKAGVGYNIAVNSKYLKELVFPMAIGGTNLTDIENTKTSNTVEIHQYTGSTTINNHNWNLVAHPYVSAFSPYSGDKITAGILEYTEPANPGEQGTWDLNDQSKVYITLPSFNSGSITYTQTLSTTITSLNPFLAVFVQGAGEGNLTFEQSGRKLSAPARHLAAEAENEDLSIFAGVTLSGNGESDETSLRIRPDFTDEYQLGYDLEKFITFYTPRPQVYMKTPSNRLAFQAVSDEVAKSSFLPMGVYCEYAGTYTFELNRSYPTDEIEAVYLYDTNTGTTTNLLYDSYSFTSTGRVYTNTRFSLNVIVKRREPQTATGMDTTPVPDAVVRKILINGHVYIQRGGALYDITGKQLLNH